MFGLGFLFQKFLVKIPYSSYNFVGNEGLYSVGKGMRKGTHKTISQRVSWVTHDLA